MTTIGERIDLGAISSDDALSELEFHVFFVVKLVAVEQRLQNLRYGRLSHGYQCRLRRH